MGSSLFRDTQGENAGEWRVDVCAALLSILLPFGTDGPVPRESWQRDEKRSEEKYQQTRIVRERHWLLREGQDSGCV